MAILGVEKIDHGANCRHGTNEDADCGFNDGPVHWNGHSPGGVGINEKRGEEAKADARGCYGAGSLVSGLGKSEGGDTYKSPTKKVNKITIFLF